MKKSILVFWIGAILSLLSRADAIAQVSIPENKVLSVKKVVKVGGRFYVEESTTTINYTELTTEMLLEVEKEPSDDANDEAEKKRAEDEAKNRKAERQERNKLLKDALKRGYEPEVKTLEEKERVNKIKEKLKV